MMHSFCFSCGGGWGRGGEEGWGRGWLEAFEKQFLAAS